MADAEEAPIVEEEESTAVSQAESDLLNDNELEANGDTTQSTEDQNEQSKTVSALEDKDMGVDDDSKQNDEKEEFDFSSEHPFEDNEETIENEEALVTDQADEEIAQEDEKETADMSKDVEDDEEEEEEEEADDAHASNSDPNVMPQVNVAVLAQRKWQVKVYPLKPADFVSGLISKVFKNARESLLYLLSPGRNARGKGEMYISSASQAMRAVFSLMRLTYFYPEINVEIIKKSDEGSIEEKAYIRFDSKMTNLLTMGTFRVGPGRKRERLIGSVFVKNLPPGTTKDVLRVMFPFAQEINYNPEKFKDCTARLVLKSRGHVIPCLKAFAKVELGGNVLELHPLEKKKRPRSKETDDDVPEAKHRKKSEDGKKEESSKDDIKSPSSKKDTAKHEGSSKRESSREAKGESKERADSKASESKDRKDAKSSSKTPARRGTGNRVGGSGRKDRHDQGKSVRPKLVGGRERSARGQGMRRGAGRNDWSAERGERNKGRLEKGSGPNRNFRDGDRNKNRSGGARSFGRSSRGFGGLRSSQGNMDRMNYGMASQGLGATVSPSSANVLNSMNADATKEMVILQSQLSMAIKNQFAMLNQAQLAVEQAKRGASNLGIGSDLQQTGRPTAKAFGGGGSGYGKRSAEQYRRGQGDDTMNQHYGGRNRSRERGMRSGRGGQAGGFAKRGTFRDQLDDSYYDRSHDMDLGMSAVSDVYGRSRDFGYDSRDLNPDGFSSGRSGYGQSGGGYSGYY